MRYYKIIADGYLTQIGTGPGGTEITEGEYADIQSVLANRPHGSETTGYRLRADLTWEAHEIELPEPEEDELTEAEVLDILLGGAL